MKRSSTSTEQPPIQGKQEPTADLSRRAFLEKLGLAGILASVGGMCLQSFRSLIPNVLYEPDQRAKLGDPTKLPEGMTFLEDKRLFVFREGRTFYAISATCTHLGCTVKYAKLNQPKTVEIDGKSQEIDFEFHCPCHGSKYYADGTNYSGPAPRPLYWRKLELAPDDGQLIVDMGAEVEHDFRLTV